MTMLPPKIKKLPGLRKDPGGKTKSPNAPAQVSAPKMVR